MEKLKALWLGNLDLGDVFWNWAVLGGLLVNVTTTVLFLFLLTVDRPGSALIVGYGFSVPYNILVAVGVWRSASRYDPPHPHGDLARAATVILMTALSLT